MTEQSFWFSKRFVFLLGLIALLSFCSYKQTKPVEGLLLDAVDRSPIANALVIGVWDIKVGNWHESGYVPFAFREALTDANGRFRIERWHSFSLFNIFRSYRDRNPGILFFKEGYDAAKIKDIDSDFWNLVDGKFRKTSSGFSVERHKKNIVILLPREIWTEETSYRNYYPLERLLRYERYGDYGFCLAEYLPTFISRFDQMVRTEKYQRIVETHRDRLSSIGLRNPVEFICGLPGCNKYKNKREKGNICEK